jgi:hypothetical protein
MAPSLDDQTARQFAAMNMYGLNEVQAKGYVRGLQRGGTGGGSGLGAEGTGRALIAMQGAMLGDVGGMPASGGGGIGTTEAMITGATIGSFMPGVGTLAGAGLGAAAGYAYSKWDSISGFFSGEGPPLFASATEKADFYQRQQAAAYDSRLAAAKSSAGYVEIDQGYAARFTRADLGGARLDFDARGSNLASQTTAAMLVAGGLETVAAGAGTTKIDDRYFRSSDLQARTAELGKVASLDEKERELVEGVAYSAATRGGRREEFEGALGRLGFAHKMVAEGPGWLKGRFAEQLRGEADTLVSFAGAGKGRAALQAEIGTRNVTGPMFRAFYQRLTGDELADLPVAFMAGRAGAVGAEEADKAAMTGEQDFLVSHYERNISIAERAIDKAGGLRGDPSEGDIRRAYSSYLESERGFTASRARGRAIDRAYQDPIIKRNDPEFEKYLQRNSLAGTNEENLVEGQAKLERKYARVLTDSDLYQRAKEAIIGGEDGKAQRLMNQATKRAWAEDPEFRTSGLRQRKIDIDQSLYRRDSTLAVPIAAAVDAFAAVRNRVTDDKKTGAEMARQIPIIGEFLATSFKEEVLKEDAALKDVKKPRTKKRASPLSKSVGWGDRENAMDSINKSLRHTQRMLANLDKRIAAMPGSGPAAEAPGTGNTTGGG